MYPEAEAETEREMGVDEPGTVSVYVPSAPEVVVTGVPSNSVVETCGGSVRNQPSSEGCRAPRATSSLEIFAGQPLKD